MIKIKKEYNTYSQEELIQYGDRIASNYFFKHQDVMNHDCQGLKDLKQEATIVVLETMSKYGQETMKDGRYDARLGKLVSDAVSNRCAHLLKTAISHSNYFIKKTEETEGLIFVEGETVGKDFKNRVAIEEPKSKKSDDKKKKDKKKHTKYASVCTGITKDDFYKTLSSELVHGFTLDGLCILFEGKELEIFIKKFIENKFEKDIANEIGLSKGSNRFHISKILHKKILPKIKKYLISKHIIEKNQTNSK